MRLPDNDVERYAKVKALNAAADQGQEAAAEHASIRWIIERYKESDEYNALAHGTLKYYRRYLRDIEAAGPDMPFAYFDRPTVIALLDSYEKPHQRRQCAAVLKNLFNLARYYGIVQKTEMDDLRLKSSPPRTRIWSEEEKAAWLQAAHEDHQAHFMVTAFMLLRYTAQRPNDCLMMARTRYNGDLIQLRQQKTKTLLAVPTHPELKAHLDDLPVELMLVSDRGRKVSYTRFNRAWQRISRRAAAILGIPAFDAQARDLRRSAMVDMALAGATTAQIASVSGHSIDETQKILDTYIPKNIALAREAIAMLPGGRNGNSV